MKILFLLFLVLVSTTLSAQSFVISKGEATYMVKMSFKKVEGTSNDIKGKIQCKENLCEFLIAVNVNTFTSSDSNRDLNMQTTVETSKLPVALAKGSFKLSDWEKPNSTLNADVEFHGITKKYDLAVTTKDSLHKKVILLLDLEGHKIVRPSLFTMKIENIVPVHFDLTWKKEG